VIRGSQEEVKETKGEKGKREVGAASSDGKWGDDRTVTRGHRKERLARVRWGRIGKNNRMLKDQNLKKKLKMRKQVATMCGEYIHFKSQTK